MDTVEKYGKTVETALEEALAALGITRDEAEIEVLDEGAKGLFGVIGNKDALVRVTKKAPVYDFQARATQFLEEVFQAMNMDVVVETQLMEKYLAVELSGKNMGILIGKRGQTLDALQYLTNLVVNKGVSGYLSVTLDTENYRARRKETLENLAHNLAKKARYSGRNVTLEPMNPYERRIIHSALQGDQNVTTYSEGEEPYRYVIIALKK